MFKGKYIPKYLGEGHLQITGVNLISLINVEVGIHLEGVQKLQNQ